MTMLHDVRNVNNALSWYNYTLMYTNTYALYRHVLTDACLPKLRALT